MKNQESNGAVAALSACAFTAALLLGAPNSFAQSDAAKPEEAGSRSVTTVQVPDASQAAPTPQAPAVAVAPSAQDAPDAQIVGVEEKAFDVPPLEVGDAALNLLAWQRSGEIASRTPRPIAGPIASRSYERYLKSFEYPIPEKFNSSVKSSSDGGPDSTK